ncbi:MAG: serine/threonine-protein kinase [Tepidisphaeraceae bacterium]
MPVPTTPRCANVLQLLSAHHEADSFMTTPAADKVDHSWISSPLTDGIGPPEPEPQPGDIIGGRYRIDATLGEGGFGTVYRAQQLTPVNRPVALKLIRSDMDSRRLIARFDVERQTLALMDHPSIARVLDAGATASDRPFFVMELVDGPPITTFCEERKLPLHDRLLLMERVCHAVQHAHTKGVIHRDIKPSNVLVSLVDGVPIPKVIDFGVAKAFTASKAPNPNHTELTHELQVIGTPQYMSPEQAETGGAKFVDTRTDVYSLGAVLYEIVTGVPPFDATELRSAGLENMLRTIRETLPSRPSTRILQVNSATQPKSPRIIRAGQLTGDVDWIVMCALEKDPGRRYQTTAELAADIRRFLEGRPVKAGPPSRRYRFAKFVRRYRFQVAAATVVLLAMATTVVVSLVMAAKARDAEAMARDAEAQARTAEAIASDAALRATAPP